MQKNQAKVTACISFACEISLFGLLSQAITLLLQAIRQTI
ncbi:hypothetical protein HAPS_0647 [Glaesserella parasuis SH0165]|uniref:Uncharacterized protein n=1 Tax=Glaesserella parasuis serovar 5 (strain SH0165) TaxID=557723 RepID=B8F4P4_GLAP5|nr:hypothetical protein HAPS_0647 [Glaesserella parasuis SH0165]